MAVSDVQLLGDALLRYSLPFPDRVIAVDPSLQRLRLLLLFLMAEAIITLIDISVPAPAPPS